MVNQIPQPGAELERIAALFGLSGRQREAVLEQELNLAVTAGAGSGKTRTLVARYLGLLSRGLYPDDTGATGGRGSTPSRLVAITFTEKAAREMRNRIRAALQDLVRKARTPAERQAWAEVDARMDSARIGTIHSLCAEILRAHPAEAGLDPQFAVVDENTGAALRAAAVEAALNWAVDQPGLLPLFKAFKIRSLAGLLAFLLNRRLDTTAESFNTEQANLATRGALADFLKLNEVRASLEDFRGARGAGTLAAAAGENLAAQIEDLLEQFVIARRALQEGDSSGAAAALFTARRRGMSLSAGRKGPIKEALRALQAAYDETLDPWLGGAAAKDTPPDPAAEQAAEEVAPLLAQVYAHTLESYRAALDERTSLDFDDLEGGTAALLQKPSIRAHWQAEVDAVLVDEFQDTNARQREIVLALAGEAPGRLFVVGDARQSIYRFRGADVTVFNGLREEIARGGGRSIDLDQTFRAHAGLLAASGALLEKIMGTLPDPQRPFHVPYTALVPGRAEARAGVKGPFVECILGSGINSEEGRMQAARGLARRLLELQAAGEIRAWDEVVLLFRASTSFPVYEEALESAGIPFVTVAGSGFYDRPEVRDLLNMLRALANPWDDLALAGLLRSPAFGISDAGLYRLRWAEGLQTPQALRHALQYRREVLDEPDRSRALRALEILSMLEPLVERIPAAEVLQALIAATDYRAVLAAVRTRLWRNVDKLVGDIQASGLVSVRAALEYIASMRDAGAREGEAAPEAEGALRLMSVHKSKGLEFPFVVLADAARKAHGGRNAAYRLGNAWVLSPDKSEGNTLAFSLGKMLDGQKDEAETRRLLYVAATRAQEKLILNGHLTAKYNKLGSEGWLKEILEKGGAPLERLEQERGTQLVCELPGGQQWALRLEKQDEPGQSAAAAAAAPWPESGAAALAEPLAQAATAAARDKELKRPFFTQHDPPAVVVGEMFHRAVRRWRFPSEGGSGLDELLESAARDMGLIEPGLVGAAVGEVRAMLARFERHPLHAEMSNAGQRLHEAPYTYLASKGGKVETGFIDCLYQSAGQWKIVDFKTDELRTQAAMDAAVLKYRKQLDRYRAAVKTLLNAEARPAICFLNVEKGIVVVEV